MRKKLPAKLAAAFDEKAKAAFEARNNGDLKEAEALLLEAWDLIPEPVYDYDFHPQVYSRKIVEFYRDSNQPAKAEQWLSRVRAAYSPPSKASTTSIAFLEATVWHDAGKFDEAFTQFKQLYKQYKLRPFQGSDPRYKDFFLKRLEAHN
jgi:hypothetical protein